MTLRQQIAVVRARLREAIRKRHQAKPGGDRRRKLARLVRDLRERLERLLARLRDRVSALPGPPGWGGARQLTNETIRIVGGRASVTSRKRVATYGNPGSDHHVSQLTADAVDFGIGTAYSLATEIKRRLTGDAGARFVDYESFYVTRRGRRYRCQGIAATHGTAPHLHWGFRRA